MMYMLGDDVRLTASERAELRDRLWSRTLPADGVRRARLILLLAQGQSYLAVRRLLGCNANYISRWKGRFGAERLAGLYSRHSGRAVEKRTPALEAKILGWTRRPVPDGFTHWSSWKLAKHLGISHMMVARVWERAGLKPHRIKRYMVSDDPDHLHYTSTYSSWLNQIENWFAKIERDGSARGIFTSVTDLARKLIHHIRHYNRAPKLIKWAYREPSPRISPDTISHVTGTRSRGDG